MTDKCIACGKPIKAPVVNTPQGKMCWDCHMKVERVYMDFAYKFLYAVIYGDRLPKPTEQYSAYKHVFDSARISEIEAKSAMLTRALMALKGMDVELLKFLRQIAKG